MGLRVHMHIHTHGRDGHWMALHARSTAWCIYALVMGCRREMAAVRTRACIKKPHMHLEPRWSKPRNDIEEALKGRGWDAQ